MLVALSATACGKKDVEQPEQLVQPQGNKQTYQLKQVEEPIGGATEVNFEDGSTEYNNELAQEAEDYMNTVISAADSIPQNLGEYYSQVDALSDTTVDVQISLAEIITKDVAGYQMEDIGGVDIFDGKMPMAKQVSAFGITVDVPFEYDYLHASLLLYPSITISSHKTVEGPYISVSVADEELPNAEWDITTYEDAKSGNISWHENLSKSDMYAYIRSKQGTVYCIQAGVTSVLGSGNDDPQLDKCIEVIQNISCDMDDYMYAQCGDDLNSKVQGRSGEISVLDPDRYKLTE